jgi:hypothetical protein
MLQTRALFGGSPSFAGVMAKRKTATNDFLDSGKWEPAHGSSFETNGRVDTWHTGKSHLVVCWRRPQTVLKGFKSEMFLVKGDAFYESLLAVRKSRTIPDVSKAGHLITKLITSSSVKAFPRWLALSKFSPTKPFLDLAGHRRRKQGFDSPRLQVLCNQLLTDIG